MHHIPERIGKYNEAFVAASTEVLDGPIMNIYKDCDGNKHSCLAAGGFILQYMQSQSLPLLHLG